VTTAQNAEGRYSAVGEGRLMMQQDAERSMTMGTTYVHNPLSPDSQP